MNTKRPMPVVRTLSQVFTALLLVPLFGFASQIYYCYRKPSNPSAVLNNCPSFCVYHKYVDAAGSLIDGDVECFSTQDPNASCNADACQNGISERWEATCHGHGGCKDNYTRTSTLNKCFTRKIGTECPPQS